MIDKTPTEMAYYIRLHTGPFQEQSGNSKKVPKPENAILSKHNDILEL